MIRAAILAACAAAAVPAAHAASSLLFDGVDDRVIVPGPVELGNGFTLEAWVLVTDLAGSPCVIANRDGATGYELDLVDEAGVEKIRLSLNGAISAAGPFGGHGGVWTHVAGTWTGDSGPSQTRVYVDGVLVGSNNFATPMLDSTADLKIGALDDGPGGSFHFAGKIDEVRVWSVALDGATLSAWKDRPATPAHPAWADLEGYWRLDEGTGQTAASEVGGLDGRLGATSGPDAFDPAWDAEDVLPVEGTSFGRLKGLHRD